jgi:hypothetical protein
MVNRKRHCLSKRHQNLVKEDKTRREEADLRRNAVLVSNEGPMDLAQSVPQLDLDEPQELTEDGLRCNSSDLSEDPAEVVPSIFEEEDSDNKEAELQWTDMIDVAVGQITAEPEETTLAATSPLFQREEAEIDKMASSDSTWYPFLNKEVRIPF